MEEHNTLIDLEAHLGRSDVMHYDDYPLGLAESAGILVEEDRSLTPAYQARPGPLVYMLAATGRISPEELKEAEDACGMNAPELEMHTIRRVVYGLNRSDSGGRNLFYTSLMLSNDLDSKEPHAMDVREKGWHYLFKPGILDIGRSGRILENSAGERFDERLQIKITPDLVYDAITEGGPYNKRIGLLKSGGDIEIIKDTADIMYGKAPFYGEIPSKFPFESKIIGTTIKKGMNTIDLTEIASQQGMRVIEHPYVGLTEKFGDVFCFKTLDKETDLNSIASGAEIVTHNIVWNLALLNLLEEDPNNFLKSGNWALYGLPVIFRNNVNLGSTGRQVKTADNRYEDGREWPSNWQSEYIYIELDANMILSALFEPGASLSQLIGFEKASPGSDYEPWETIYKKGTDISPTNRRLFETAKEKPHLRAPHLPDELIDGLKMKGLKPVKRNSLN